MAYWILKTEPGTYSFERLAKERTATWDGVSNPVALANLRRMRPGDTVMIYHTGGEKQCVGLAEVTSEAYADPNAGNERLVVVDLKAGEALAKPVTLAAVRAEQALADLALVRMPRLSVVACTEGQWRALMRMAK